MRTSDSFIRFGFDGGGDGGISLNSNRSVCCYVKMQFAIYTSNLLNAFTLDCNSPWFTLRESWHGVITNIFELPVQTHSHIHTHQNPRWDFASSIMEWSKAFSCAIYLSLSMPVVLALKRTHAHTRQIRLDKKLKQITISECM